MGETITNPPEQVEVPQIALEQPTIDISEQQAKEYIYFKESTNRTDAINPESGACGIGQAWPCEKLPCSLTDFVCQDNWFTEYMRNRYGSWVAAMQFHQQNNWW